MSSRECKVGDSVIGINSERGYCYKRTDSKVIAFCTTNQELKTIQQVYEELRNEEHHRWEINENALEYSQVEPMLKFIEKIDKYGSKPLNDDEKELIQELNKSFFSEGPQDNIMMEGITDFEEARNAPEQYIKQACKLDDYRNYSIMDKDLEHILVKTEVPATLIHGEAGTGKTSQVKAICARYNIPCYQMQLNEQSLPSDLLSEFIPNTEDNSSTIKLKKSQFTIAFQYGGVCLIDEINMASPGSLAALNSALDDSKQIILANGEVIRRHPLFRLVATANLGYEGTQDFNDATLNRFLVLAPYVLTKTNFRKIMKSKNIDNDLTTFFWSLLTKIKSFVKSNDIPAIVSIRNIEQAIMLRGLGIETAYQIAFIEPLQMKADKPIKNDMLKILQEAKSASDN